VNAVFYRLPYVTVSLFKKYSREISNRKKVKIKKDFLELYLLKDFIYATNLREDQLSIIGGEKVP